MTQVPGIFQGGPKRYGRGVPVSYRFHADHLRGIPSAGHVGRYDGADVPASGLYHCVLYDGIPYIGYHGGASVLYDLQAGGEKDSSPVQTC